MIPKTLACKLEARYRRIRRIVETPQFQYAYNKGDKDSAIKLIISGNTKKLKDWVHVNGQLVDAPIRWLRSVAKKNNIKNHSILSRIQLANELARILK